MSRGENFQEDNVHVLIEREGIRKEKGPAKPGLQGPEKIRGAYEHPLVLPHVSHFRQVPFRTIVKFPHSPQASPS
jgi:hypothetical protein